MTRERRINPILLDYIRDAARTLGAKAIRTDIARQPELAALGVPALRTVQDIVAETRGLPETAEQPAEWWWNYPVQQVALIIEALHAILPREPRLTDEQLRRLGFLRVAAPTLPPKEAVRLSRSAIDNRVMQYLVHAPWLGDGSAYIAAVRRPVLSEYTIPAYKRWANEKRAASRSQPPADVPGD